MTSDYPLIEVSELERRLREGRTVVVDCRFRLTEPTAGVRAYEKGHIPGARYADLDKDLARSPGPGEGRHPLPAADDFAATLGRWGISASSHVTVYDDAGGAIAARLWWMLRWLGHERVALLNGGLEAWLDAGLALEVGRRAVAPASYRIRAVEDSDCVATDELISLLRNGCVLLDARSRERFIGAREPIDPVAGHVPGALNLPFERCLGPDGRFLDRDALRGLFEARLDGRDPARCVTMCGSGVTACHLLVGMAAAGLEGGRLYVGSWSEWLADPTRPVATGEAS